MATGQESREDWIDRTEHRRACTYTAPQPGTAEHQDRFPQARPPAQDRAGSGGSMKTLKWCQTMAMFNATKTNPTLGKFMHDECNKMFGGAFGDWQEPSELERLGVKQHAA